MNFSNFKFINMCEVLINFKIVTGILLMERHPAIFWTPCAAHCLDLMLEDIGKTEWVKSCVERAKSICKFIYNHAFVLATMKKYMKNRELTHSGITKFDSNFITPQSLMTSREELRHMIVGEEFVSSSYAKTTAGIDVGNILFDEDGFWEYPLRCLCRKHTGYSEAVVELEDDDEA